MTDQEKFYEWWSINEGKFASRVNGAMATFLTALAIGRKERMWEIPDRCDFEPNTAPEAFLQQEMQKIITSFHKNPAEKERLAESIIEACQYGASVSDIMAMIDGALDTDKCKGIDLGDGDYSGCLGIGCDCPKCGR